MDRRTADEQASPSAPVAVSVVRRLASSPECVFGAWLNPEMIGRWMFGPALRDEQILHLQVDARVGGAFSFLVRRKGTDIDHVGRYLALERPNRLEFTWGIAGESSDESRVIVEIAPSGAGCELRLTHMMSAKWADFAERTQAGWTRMLEELSAALS